MGIFDQVEIAQTIEKFATGEKCTSAQIRVDCDDRWRSFVLRMLQFVRENFQATVEIVR